MENPFSLYNILNQPQDAYYKLALTISIQPEIADDKLAKEVWGNRVNALNKLPPDDVRLALSTIEGLQILTGKNVSPLMIDTAICWATEPVSRESTLRAFPPASVR
jgi:hypothetical protein